jgi:hypothetical protein
MLNCKCPSCGKAITTGEEHAGKKARCPGCKETFVLPSAVKAAPSAERRTRPQDDDNLETVEEAPRKSKRSRDEEDDADTAEVVRKKRSARDADEDDDDLPARRRRDRDDDEDDEPRARRRRDRDDDEDDDDDRPSRRRRARDEYDDEDEEDDRPRRKKKRRKGPWADCPGCGSRGDATRVYWQYGLGFLPWFFSAVRCNRCGASYNGKHGDYNTTRYLIYFAIVIPLALAIGVLSVIFGDHR